ncbi:MAG: dephospho-CoA kinase [Pseudomonadota bacterium]
MSKFQVGLTGGIGSGKTSVSNRFADWGITIVDADLVARDVVAPGQPALTAIVAHFGDQVLNDSGELDRKALRHLIFKDPDERQWLNQLLHPLIQKQFQQQLRMAQSDYVIGVVPLLYESLQSSPHAYTFDRIIVVDCDESLQIARTIERDNIDDKLAKQMLNQQASRQQRLSLADDIIVNNANENHLFQQVDQLHKQLLVMATHH